MTKNVFNVPTSNFIIHLDKIDRNLLQANYELFALEIPNSFSFLQDQNKFAKLHNSYKQQLDLPYYFYSYAKPQATIFVLLPKTNIQEKTISLTLDFLDKTPILAQKREIREFCSAENLHILAKLFLADCFYRHQKTYRLCNEKVYAYVADKKTLAAALALEISKPRQNDTVFEIKNQTVYFYKTTKKFVKPEYVNLRIYCELISGEKYYKPLKTEDVKKWASDKKNELDVWQLEDKFLRKQYENNTKKGKKPVIKWFADYDGLTSCKSFLILDFQNKLMEHYNEKIGQGSAERQFHQMKKLKATSQFASKGFGEETGLYLKLLGQVGMLDLRFKEIQNANQIPFQKYVDFFNEKYGKMYEISFSEISRKELKNCKNPVLVLLDAEKKLFEKEDYLLGYDDDPKPILYREFSRKIPLQTLNTNPTKIKNINEVDLENYFNYDFFDDSESVFKHKLQVCLNELLLKHYIINELPISGTEKYNSNDALPSVIQIKSLRKFSYMHENILMYIENNVLKFIDLEDQKGKAERNLFLSKLRIDWLEIEKTFTARNYDQSGKKLQKARFVFAENLALSIEDTEERVLHTYDPNKKDASQRTKENKTALEGIFYSESEQIYTVGYKSLNQTADKAVIVRKWHYYQKPEDFKIEDLLATLSVQFVKNKQYTVYPYFFDLLRLYKEDIKRHTNS